MKPKTKSKEMTVIAIPVPADIKKKLKSIALEADLTLTALVNEVLAEKAGISIKSETKEKVTMRMAKKAPTKSAKARVYKKENS